MKLPWVTTDAEVAHGNFSVSGDTRKVGLVTSPKKDLICWWSLTMLKQKHENSPVDNHSHTRTIKTIEKVDVWCYKQPNTATKNQSPWHLKINSQPEKDKRTKKTRSERQVLKKASALTKTKLRAATCLVKTHTCNHKSKYWKKSSSIFMAKQRYRVTFGQRLARGRPQHGVVKKPRASQIQSQDFQSCYNM